MQPGFPLVILLGASVPSLSAQGNRALLGEIVRAEDRRALSERDLGVLVGALGSPDTLVLARAIRAIGRLERPPLAERLISLLAHPAVGVRVEAAQAVAQAAQGFRNDSSPERGASWSGILAALGRRAGEERDPVARAMLALSIGRLPYASPEEIRQAREWLLTFPEPAAARGMETLARLTARRLPLEPAFASRLQALARDETIEPRLRRHALGALLVAPAADHTTLALAMRAEDPFLRRLAVTGLGRITVRGERDPLIGAGLSDASPAVRFEAVRLWARLAGPVACPRLLDAVSDTVPRVVLLALDLLGTTCPGDSLATRAVLDAASAGAPGGAWHRASHALVSLARLAPERAPRLLPAAAAHATWQVRMYAARAAAVLPDTQNLRRLASDPAPNVREAALAGLKEVSGHAADPLYRAALAASDYQLVLTAAGALAGSPARRAAAEALLAALDRITRERRETSRDPRAAILVRLRELGEPALAPRLLAYLADFDPLIADSAAAIVTTWSGAPRRAAPRRLVPAPVSLLEAEALRGKRLHVTMASGGVFEVELFVDDAPATVLRVARLVRRGYYDGLTFHRIVPNFVIQGGGPGANEYMGDGPFMRDELGPRSHQRGTLGISTRGRDTGDAQWFVNLMDNPRLDYDYTVWGRVIGEAGIEVVDAVQEGDVIRRVEMRPVPAARPNPVQTVAPADTAALMATVRVLAADSMEGRRIGTPGSARARRYLIERLHALGLTPLGPSYEQTFAMTPGRGGGTGVNLVALIPGTRSPERYIVLSAHYDHVGIIRGQIYNGADDNASGTAAVLAIADQIRKAPLAHSVIVALFDGEEGGLLGSTAFVAGGTPPFKAFALDVNLDMVGHSESGELWAAGASHTPALRPVLDSLRSRAPVKLRLGHDAPGVSGEQDWTGESDHAAFHRVGIPFIYFGVVDHKDYHRPSDDPETLTPAFFGGAVGTILAALRALDAAVR